MKTPLFFVCIIFSTISFAQNSFEFTLNTFKDESIFSIIENNNKQYLLTGCIRDTYTYSKESAYIALIDIFGNLIAENSIQLKDTFLYFESAFQKTNNNYIVFGRTKVNNSSTQSLFVCEFDQNLNIVKRKQFSLIANKFLDMELPYLNSSNNLVVYGSLTEFSNNRLYLDYLFFEISQELDSIKMLIQPENIEEQIHINSLTSRSAGGYFAFSNQFTRPSKILYLDNDFNILSQKEIPEEIYGFGTIKTVSDSTYYIVGKKTHYNKYQDDDIACILLDTSHTTIHALEYFGKPETSDIGGRLETMDFIDKDKIYIAGIHKFYYGGPPDLPAYDNYIYIIQTDSLLNVKREIFYGGNMGYYVYSVKATSDGGCIVAASRYDTDNQQNERDALILKFDAELNLPVSIEEHEIKAHELILYPNPGSAHLNIRTAVQSLGGQFCLYDIKGKLVYQQTITERYTEINTEALPAGSYIYSYVLKNHKPETGKWIKL